MSDEPLRRPTLRGVALQRRGGRFVYPDGRPVADADVPHIEFLPPPDGIARAPLETRVSPAPSATGWWSAVDGSLEEGFAALRDDEWGDAPGATLPQNIAAADTSQATESGALSTDDLSFALRAVALDHHSLPAVEFDAAFFHRTLARWMGLSVEGMPRDDEGPVWDYDFWKAELVEETASPPSPLKPAPDPDAQTAGARRHVYRVMVHRGEQSEPEHYRYWIEVDSTGELRTSGWLSEAPDLLVEKHDESSAFVPPAPRPDLLEALFAMTDG